MARELRTRDQLNDLLDKELQQHRDGIDAQVISIAETEPDASGCNWIVTQWTEGRSSHAAVERALEAPVAAARARFNLGAPKREDGG